MSPISVECGTAGFVTRGDAAGKVPVASTDKRP